MNFRKIEDHKVQLRELDNEYLVTLENLGSSMANKIINQS
jgi:hypothetical protein